MSEPPPPTVPGYEPLRLLGRGGQGTVWLARSCDQLGRELALKVFPQDGLANYRRELETWQRIEEIRRQDSSGRLVEGVAAGMLPAGGAYVAMAYHPLGSLAEMLDQAGPLPEQQALRLGHQAAEALALLHQGDVIHRDVKPSNLLRRSPDTICLTDFGLCRSSDGSVTAAGTLGYCAPELHSGQPIPASEQVLLDVYSLGATLHALVVGHPPRPGRMDLFALEGVGVSRATQDVLARALAEDPLARYPSMLDLQAALREAMAGRRTAPRPVRWRLRMVSVAVVLVAVLVTVGLFREATQPADPVQAQPSTTPDPPEPSYLLNKARQHLDQARYNQAIACVEELLKAHPGNGQARLVRVSAWLFQGKEAEAEAELWQLLPEFPGWTLVRSKLAEILYRRGAQQEALALIQPCLEAAPADLVSNRLLYWAQQHLGEWELARQSAERQIAASPNDALGYACKASALHHLQRPAEAAKAWRQVAVAGEGWEGVNTDVTGELILFNQCLLTGQLERALDLANRLELRHPGTRVGPALRGLAYEKVDPEASRQALQAADRLPADWPDLGNHVFAITPILRHFLTLRRFEDAAQMALDLSRAHPDHAVGHVIRALALDNLGRHKEAAHVWLHAARATTGWGLFELTGNPARKLAGAKKLLRLCDAAWAGQTHGAGLSMGPSE